MKHFPFLVSYYHQIKKHGLEKQDSELGVRDPYLRANLLGFKFDEDRLDGIYDTLNKQQKKAISLMLDRTRSNCPVDNKNEWADWIFSHHRDKVVFLGTYINKDKIVFKKEEEWEL